MSRVEINQFYVLVIVTYNEGYTLGAVIDAVTPQRHPPSRWILVTDGSTDQTDALTAKLSILSEWKRF